MSEAYAWFLAAKSRAGASLPQTGQEAELPQQAADSLFGFQRRIVDWAVRRQRAAVFADTGLGKSRILLAYAAQVLAAHPGGCVLVLGPLCTAVQLTREAAAMGLTNVTAARSDPCPSAREGSIVVTNYEIADKFDFEAYTALVLDESSILKDVDSKTCVALTARAAAVAYRLALTATPCPNDFAELLNQAAFLGIATRDFLLATFFRTLMSGKVVLRAHAAGAFVRWLSTWSVWVSSPGDVGFPGEAARYVLPELTREYLHVASAAVAEEEEGREEPPKKKAKKKAGGVVSRAAARRATLADRIAAVVQLVNADPAENWVVWCTLNDESKALAAAISGAVELTGTDKLEAKETKLAAFCANADAFRPDARVIVTKPEIAGFGLNWQFCRKMVFVSVTDSYERIYQAERRCYRFGQTRPVSVTFVTTDAERAAALNVARKEAGVSDLKAQMRDRMRELWRPDAALSDILADSASVPPPPDATELRSAPSGAQMILGDCVAGMQQHLPADSVDYSVFSPPFQSLYRWGACLSRCKITLGVLLKPL